MIKLFLGNRAEDLAEKLACELRKPSSSPLCPEIISIQARGMERWLSMKIAQKNGVCANTDFIFPKKIINQIIHSEKGLSFDNSPFRSEAMAFSIFRILGNPDALGAEFDVIRNYCKGDKNGLKRFRLAFKIAETFEKYLFYRPDLINEWNSRTENGGNWQASLWSIIRSETDVPDPSILIKEFIIKAVNGQISKNLIPRRISFFGITNLPKPYIAVLGAISEFCDISFFCLSPCREYWANIPRISQRKAAVRKREIISEMHFDNSNQLLESLGECSTDFFELLYSNENIDEFDLFSECSSDHNKSILSFIQSSMLNLEDPTSQKNLKHKLATSDSSLEFHSCHSPMREAEILFDRILAMFEEKPDLSPSDIIVMTPDIDSYAPFIETVFGSRGGSGTKIPYSVADRLPRDEKKAADCFMSILKLGKSRLYRQEVMDILEHPCVSSRFGIDEEDLEIIKKWLKEARISGELDESHRIQIGLPGFKQNSWADAIDRLLLGIAMQNEDLDSFCGISPIPGITATSFGTLSKLLDFWSTLSETAQNLRTQRTIDEWRDFLYETMDAFLDDNESGYAKRDLRNAVSRLTELAQSSNLNEKTDIAVISDFIKSEFDKPASSYGFLGGGVTFCAMLPMRSIPFRIICLLGMNSDSFPRKDNLPGFDLTAENPMPGDPSIRRDDRQLFLDILISARETLYISYTGQSSRDNSVIPPSVLVSELMDYVDESAFNEDGSKVSDSLLFKHPMHGFSQSNFENNGRIFSYNIDYFRAAKAILSRKKDKRDFWDTELTDRGDFSTSVSISDFKRFWKNPCEFAVSIILGADLGLDESEDAISCVSIPSSLERHTILNRTLDLRNHFNDSEKRRQVIDSQGRLPHGDLGDLVQINMESEIDRLEESVDFKKFQKLTIEAEVQSGDTLIYGTVRALVCDDGADKKMLFIRYGSINPANVLLLTWIDFLIARASGCDAASFELAGFSDSKSPRSVSVLKSKPVSIEEASRHIDVLISYFCKGIRKPLHFMPEASFAFAEAIIKGQDEKALYSAIESSVSGFYTNIKKGFYEDLCFGDSIAELFFDSEEFRQSAEDVCIPLINILKSED